MTTQPGEGAIRQAFAEAKNHVAAILDEVSGFIRRYVVLTPKQSDTVTLWTAHCHAFAAAETTPYISVRSVEKRSGKSRLLEVVELVVPKPQKAENISVAALAHVVDRGCTLMLDEIDSIFAGGKAGETQETQRGILNSGYRTGGSYLRMAGVGANMAPRDFKTFGPKMLAGIGRLPGTLEDRAIPIDMLRKTKRDVVERFRYKEAKAHAQPIRESLEAWAGGAIEQLMDAGPEIPDELDDRAADCWEPLLAIADLAGGEWPRRARSAAIALSAGEARDDQSLGVRLLWDLRAVFGEQDKLPSAELVESLMGIEEAPWRDIDGKGRPLNAGKLASMLAPHNIKPKQHRFGDKNCKGYIKSAFEDAWERYCPPINGETSETAKHEPVGGVSGGPVVSGNIVNVPARLTESEWSVSRNNAARGNIPTEDVSGVSGVSGVSLIRPWRERI